MPTGVYERTAEHRAKIAASKRGKSRPDMVADNPMRREGVADRNADARRGPRTDTPSYSTVHHDRLPAALGRASSHRCIDCGGPAREWSYRGRVGYSADPADYDARCNPCHSRYDKETT